MALVFAGIFDRDLPGLESKDENPPIFHQNPPFRGQNR